MQRSYRLQDVMSIICTYKIIVNYIFNAQLLYIFRSFATYNDITQNLLFLSCLQKNDESSIYLRINNIHLDIYSFTINYYHNYYH